MRVEQVIRSVSAALIATALAGCSESEAPAPDGSSTDASTSIIRDGFERPAPAPPSLAPLETRIGFAEGGTELDENALAELETVLASPQLAAGGAILLRAHTDSQGTDEANMEASRERGEAVRDWLIEREVAEERITVISFGEQNPAEPNALPDGSPNEDGRRANRRVDVTVEVETEEGEEARPSLAETVAGEREDASSEPTD